MRTYGEDFNQSLAGLEDKPGKLIDRLNRQPAGVVLDIPSPYNVETSGKREYPPIIWQPRVKGSVR